MHDLVASGDSSNKSLVAMDKSLNKLSSMLVLEDAVNAETAPELYSQLTSSVVAMTKSESGSSALRSTAVAAGVGAIGRLVEAARAATTDGDDATAAAEVVPVEGVLDVIMDVVQNTQEHNTDTDGKVLRACVQCVSDVAVSSSVRACVRARLARLLASCIAPITGSHMCVALRVVCVSAGCESRQSCRCTQARKVRAGKAVCHCRNSVGLANRGQR